MKSADIYSKTTEQLIQLYDAILSYLNNYLMATEFKTIDRVRVSRQLQIKEWEFNRLLQWLIIKEYILKRQSRSAYFYKKLESFQSLSSDMVLKWIEEYNYELTKDMHKKELKREESWREYYERKNETQVAEFGFYGIDKWMWFSSLEAASAQAVKFSLENGISHLDIVIKVAEVVSQPTVNIL